MKRTPLSNSTLLSYVVFLYDLHCEIEGRQRQGFPKARHTYAGGETKSMHFDQDISIFLSTDTDTEAAQSAIYSGERVETE